MYNINKSSGIKDIYNEHFKKQQNSKIIIGNGLNTKYSVEDFLNMFTKGNFIKILEDTKEFYSHNYNLYKSQLEKLINKLKNYKVYNKATVLKILVGYYKIVEDIEDYLIIEDNINETRLYVWFGIK